MLHMGVEQGCSRHVRCRPGYKRRLEELTDVKLERTCFAIIRASSMSLAKAHIIKREPAKTPWPRVYSDLRRASLELPMVKTILMSFQEGLKTHLTG